MTATATGHRPPPAVVIGGGVTTSRVECAACEWGRLGMGRRQWLASRAAAIRHARATGHPVLAEVATGYTYAPIGEPAPRSPHV